MRLLSFAASLNRWLSGSTVLPSVQRLAILYGLLFLATNFALSWLTPGLAYGARGVIGADFLAFYTAGDLTLQGRALEAYNLETFDAALQTRIANENLGLMWQYPPLMFFVAAALALVPYKLSLWLWLTATGAAFAWAVNRILKFVAPDLKDRRLALLLVLASPICMAVVTSGQISLLTAALLMTAAFRPRTHWLLAGLAAGLLTIKPQLGVLLPFAFLVAGAWRAFGVAALSSVVLHAMSLIVFGPDSAQAFIDAVIRLQSDVAGSGINTPPVNMTTLFAQLRDWNVSSSIAMPLHITLAALVFGGTLFLWRRHAGQDERGLFLAALIGAGAILVTPYAYAYEMTALAPAALWLALRPERFGRIAIVVLAALWILLAIRRFVPLDDVIQVPFLVSVIAFGLLASAGFGATKDRPIPADR